MDAGMVDAVTGGMTAVATVAADPGTADTVPGLLSEFLNLLGGIGGAGTWAAIAGLVWLLIRLSKLPIVDPLFKRGPKWLRIAVAAGLGTIAGALTGIPGGLMGVLAGAVKGALSGLGAVGANTGLARMTKDGAAEVALVRAVRETLKADEANADKAKATMTAAFEGALKIADKKKRFVEMAKLANGAVKP